MYAFDALATQQDEQTIGGVYEEDRASKESGHAENNDQGAG